MRLARNPMERRYYADRLEACDAGATSIQGLEAMWDHALAALCAVVESDRAAH